MWLRAPVSDQLLWFATHSLVSHAGPKTESCLSRPDPDLMEGLCREAELLLCAWWGKQVTQRSGQLARVQTGRKVRIVEEVT